MIDYTEMLADKAATAYLRAFPRPSQILQFAGQYYSSWWTTFRGLLQLIQQSRLHRLQVLYCKIPSSSSAFTKSAPSNRAPRRDRCSPRRSAISIRPFASK